MAAGKFIEFLKSFDGYGHPVGVHYKGSGTYQTKLGCLCTLVTYCLILVNLVTQTTKFYDGSNLEINSTTLFYDRSEA